MKENDIIIEAYRHKTHAEEKTRKRAEQRIHESYVRELEEDDDDGSGGMTALVLVMFMVYGFILGWMLRGLQL
jgi:hypothetical protein